MISPRTFSTGFLILVFCYFGVSEPPPSHGYGPASPVDFTGSNEGDSSLEREQYDGNNFGSHGSYSGGSPNYSNLGPSYKPGSFSGGSSNYRGGGYTSGVKNGGSSSSYINIVHGPASGTKLRPGGYSAYSAFPSKTGPSPSYSNSNFGAIGGTGYSAYNDGKLSNNYAGGSEFSGNNGFGASHSAAGYSSPVTDSVLNKGNYANVPPSYSSGEIGSDYSNGYKKEYDFGTDDLASYSSGGPTYATVGSSYTRGGQTATGSYNGAGIHPSYISGGNSRGTGAYSTTNVIGQAQYSGRIGHDYTPSRFKNGASSSPNGASKGFPRFGGTSSSSSGGYFAAPSNAAENVVGFNGRSLKGGYVSSSPSFGGSSGENDFYSGQFSDGADVKVQSSYTAY